MNKFAVGLCWAVELGCLIGITGIALKRNNECYKAECALHDEKMAHLGTQLEMVGKDYEIRVLKKKLEEVQAQEVEES